MEAGCDSGSVSGRILEIPRSDSKVILRENRDCDDVEEISESGGKRVKMRDLESVFRSEGGGSKGEEPLHPPIDLNANVIISSKKSEIDPNKSSSNRRRDFDLNLEDTSSSFNFTRNPINPDKNYQNPKSRDESECASSVGPTQGKDPMLVWKEMKQNGYLSSSHGGVPIPKIRAKRGKNHDLKKKIDLAKKEQVDRFAKIAAPSGLLNGLNPGIINHVRNSKQVHAIIEAIVRSEKLENCQTERKENGYREFGDKKKEKSNLCINKSLPLNSGIALGEDDGLALKLSSSMSNVTDNAANLTSVTSLSVKAANVASQWLELLTQDIKGRLTALRRSKKRVRAVMLTELPCIMSREFSSNQESSDNGSAYAHRTRWNSLFGQMDSALLEEERQLENWLNQVKEMQLHCEKGLLHLNSNMASWGNDGRLEKADNPEMDLAVRAAAASIYSTCNFLLSMEKLPCF